MPRTLVDVRAVGLLARLLALLLLALGPSRSAGLARGLLRLALGLGGRLGCLGGSGGSGGLAGSGSGLIVS